MKKHEFTLYVEVPVKISVYDYPGSKAMADCPGEPASWDLAEVDIPLAPMAPVSQYQFLNKHCPDWEQKIDELIDAARRDEAEYNMELRAEAMEEKKRLYYKGE